MPTFAYSGRTRAGQNVTGERIADSMDAAVAALRREQIMVTRIDAAKAAKAAAKPKAVGMKGKKVPSKNLAIFVRQFSVMIDAGLPLVQCLEILGKQEPHKHFAYVILKTREDVESGASLADAMKKHPKTFDALFTNMIAAGEAGGILDTILKRLATYIEKSVKLQGDVKSAMIYPIAVIVIAGIVVTAILWKVIPTFASLFAGLGAQLPMPTRIVIALSDYIVAYGWIAIIVMGLGFYALKTYYATPGGRHADALMLKLPILGSILRRWRWRGSAARCPRSSPRACRSSTGSTSRPAPPATPSSKRPCRRRAPASSAAKRSRRRCARPGSSRRWSCR